MLQAALGELHGPPRLKNWCLWPTARKDLRHTNSRKGECVAYLDVGSALSGSS
jgi:hypothetical protein